MALLKIVSLRPETAAHLKQVQDAHPALARKDTVVMAAAMRAFLGLPEDERSRHLGEVLRPESKLRRSEAA